MIVECNMSTFMIQANEMQHLNSLKAKYRIYKNKNNNNNNFINYLLLLHKVSHKPMKQSEKQRLRESLENK